MHYPIERFGWKLIDSFTYSNGRKSFVFQKEGINIIFREGDEVDLGKLNSTISIQDDSFTEAIKETQNIINNN